MSERVASTKYCWVEDLKVGNFLANSRQTVRVMGVVVSIHTFLPSLQAFVSPFRTIDLPGNDRKEKTEEPKTAIVDKSEQFVFVTIDDGSETLVVCASRAMIESPHRIPAIEVGKTYDCVLRLRQKSTTRRWFAEAFILVDNPLYEHLRWLELSSREIYAGANISQETGFPVRQRNASEVYRLIRLHVRYQEDEYRQSQESRNFRHFVQTQDCKRRRPGQLPGKPSLGLGEDRIIRNGRKTCTTKSNNMLAPKVLTSVPDESSTPSSMYALPHCTLTGLLLEDLALVLQKPQRDVQEMIEDLQMEGKIYKNKKGEYLPL